MVYSSWVRIYFVQQNFNFLCLGSTNFHWFLNRLAEDAAQASYEQRDIQSLWVVHMNAVKNNDRDLITKVENYIALLSTKK